ncbi:MAG: type 1 glutamine amidotransferase [Myxococcota bacterium]|nr:type 1 glutamine amidotransferase [Myxococcota bacterium]MEC9391616.1 type 1 glutamine amidotransferase [Myxococcota bacterium]
MATVLIIDCYVEGDGSENYRRLMPDRTIDAWRPDLEAPPQSPDQYDAIMITGSAACVTAPEPWMDLVMAFLQSAAALRVPVLGICFGHQILAAAVFGVDAVRKSRTPEIGWYRVQSVVHNPPIFDGLDSSFTAFMSHFDEVEPRDGMTVLAQTDRCSVASYRVDGYPMWGVQFHPEMAQQEAEELVVLRITGRPDLGFDVDATLSASRDSTALAQRLFANFFAAS